MSERETPTLPRPGATPQPRAPSLRGRGPVSLRDARRRSTEVWGHIASGVRSTWAHPQIARLRKQAARWTDDPRAGAVVLAAGIAASTILIVLIDLVALMPNPGLVYLPVVAMLAYHWGWRHAAVAGVIELLCVYVLFVPPVGVAKPLNRQTVAQLIALAAVTAFVLALVQLARARRTEAEREAQRFAALHQVGAALTSELGERGLLDRIARTARELTGAEFAAFTLRPVNEMGQPLGPAEGSRFHLAAVVGVTPAQEELFKRIPLGGEGVLAPIFRHGVSVRVPDALAAMAASGVPFHQSGSQTPAAATAARETARQVASEYAHGHASAASLRSLGVPRGHPVVRSFLGAPLLDRDGQVRGGLLLGHNQPDRFTAEDEALLVGLASQAAIALENARLYQASQDRARELATIFQSIRDGITLVDAGGTIQRENEAAHDLRAALERQAGGGDQMTRLLHALGSHPTEDGGQSAAQVAITTAEGEREYSVSAAPLRPAGNGATGTSPTGEHDEQPSAGGAVIVWHDVTEARRLLEEQQAHAEAESRRALLQAVMDELPSGIYLVRGRDARLVLANRAAHQVWGAQWPTGQPMREFLRTSGTRILGPDGRPIPTDELATIRALRTRSDVRHHQEVIRQRGGQALPVLLNAVAIDPAVLGRAPDAPAAEDERQESAAIVVLQDVTALKEAERLKDEFIGIAAHELRTPLAAVKGYAEMLVMQTARGHGQDLEDWQREALESIDQSATRLSELTDDLLDVTRLQAGRLELHIEPGDLLALVRRVAKRMQVTTDRHHLNVHADADFVVVCMDPHRMEQVLANVIGNAVKYSPEGGDVDITVCEDTAAGVARLDVRDRGVGIPAAQQARVFGRFARADNATALGIKGTGLGLYITRELVERHDGRIWFDSVEDQGTTFHIALPLLHEDESAPGDEAATAG